MLNLQTLQGIYNPIPLGQLLCIKLLGTKENMTQQKKKKGKAVSTVTGLEWPRGFQEVKVPRFHDNGTGWW
jgi:hypothetical protein